MRQIIIILCSFILFSACKDYLDMVPEKDIETIESIFELKANADTWLEGVYSKVNENVTNCRTNPSFFGADEVLVCDAIRNMGESDWTPLYGIYIADGLQMSQKPYGNLWDDKDSYSCCHYESIRNANTFIEHIDDVYNMEPAEKRQWKAEMMALKAYLYFDLVRHYGPIVLVSKNQSVEDDVKQLRLPRQHVDTCFKEIVRLLDEASKDLLLKKEKITTRYAYFNKEAALALKAQVLLYAASPLFNGNEYYAGFKGKDGEPLFSTEYDHEKWRLAAEAADEAIRVACEEGGHELYEVQTAQGSELLNVMYNVEHSVLSQFDNPEMLLEWKDMAGQNGNMVQFCLPRFKSTDTHYNSKATGGVSPTIKAVEMYYTENGLPIDVDNTWNYSGRYRMSRETSPRYTGVVALNTDVLQLHLRREPRFYACIAADRTYWQRGPKGGWVDNNLLVQAYKGERFGTTMDIVSSIVYQNQTGYWLKKFLYSSQDTKNYNSSNNTTFPVLRLAELYLIQAEAWNEYEGPSKKVYDALNKVRKRAGIPDVETAWKFYSRDPGRVDTKEGMRSIIRQEINIEMAFEGARFWNLRRWKTAHEELNERRMGWNILGENASAFYNNFSSPKEVGRTMKFQAPRDYFFPLRAEEALISGSVQNPGW